MDFAGAFITRDLGAEFLLVYGPIFGLKFGQFLARFRVDFLMALREQRHDRFRHAFDLEIPRVIAYPITKVFEALRELVVIDVFDELLRLEHLVVLERLPPVFLVIEGRVEKHAMRMQMRVECPTRVMAKQRSHHIACFAILR